MKNDCNSCQHKTTKLNNAGWCYMFKKEPDTFCVQHTKVDIAATNYAKNFLEDLTKIEATKRPLKKWPWQLKFLFYAIILFGWFILVVSLGLVAKIIYILLFAGWNFI
jgi:hypothetical protein